MILRYMQLNGEFDLLYDTTLCILLFQKLTL